MKRTAAAGTFALLAGGATLLMLASIVYSCRGGGHPHDMGTSSKDASSHSTPTAQVETESPSDVDATAHQINVRSSSPQRL